MLKAFGASVAKGFFVKTAVSGAGHSSLLGGVLHRCNSY
jgi:hypothetical protein